MAEVIETTLELSFDELLKVVVAQTTQAARFKILLKRLENTLRSIQPVFYDRWRLTKVLDRPQKETKMFISYLEKEKELVLKCSRINFWNVYKNFLHSNKLVRLNNRLLRFFQIELQAKMMRTSMRSLVGIHDLAEKMDQVLLATVTTQVRAYSSSRSVPGLPPQQHDLLRELAIHLSSQEPIAERKRFLMEFHRNEFPTWWIKQITQPINARILSLSTDEAFSSIWPDLKAPKVEVLTLNIRSKRYLLPKFIKRMGQLKVLTIISNDGYPSQLHNLSLMGSLSNLRKIRFEHVSVSSIQPIFELRNLRKLSFVMCEIGDALMSCDSESPYLLPNLTDLEIDGCHDLKELPSGLCNLVHLKKLRVTNCHELDVLPKGLGSLSNLEILALHCCTKLQELPKSIGILHNLSLIDISDCLSISELPEEIGDLCGLKVLKMDGCSGLQEVPASMSKLWQLEEVICDEETSYLWMDFESDIHNLKISVVEDDRFECFMKIVH